MLEEANRLVTTIKQMEASLDDVNPHPRRTSEDPDLRITFPLNRCLNTLSEKHSAVARLHHERFEQVKSRSIFLTPEDARY